MALSTRQIVLWTQEAWTGSSPLQIAVASLCLLLLSISLSLRRLLRPVDQRPAPYGKTWKLPPGPRGWPMIGNLLLYYKGEAGVGSYRHTKIDPQLSLTLSRPTKLLAMAR